MPVHLKPPTTGESWAVWYAWRPVFPVDDHGFFWLEDVWHRRDPRTGRQDYRSFRTEAAKLRELIARAL